MADYIETDTMLLEKDRQTIQSELEQIRNRIIKLKEQMTHLGTMWEGPAYQAFMAQFQKDCEFIQEFGDEIAAYVDTMEYAVREYQRCEQEAQEAVASIQV